MAKTFQEVFPATLPATAIPPMESTIIDNHIAPYYLLGWRFAEYDLRRHFAKQSEWNASWGALSDSQLKWVDPRWKPYGKDLPHRHRPMFHVMPGCDALFQIAINVPIHMRTLKEFELSITEAAVDVLRLPEDKAAELKWHRVDPFY